MKRWLPVLILLTSLVVVYDYHVNPTGWYDLALFFLPLTLILTILLIRKLPTNVASSPDPVAWQSFTPHQIIMVLLGVLCFMILAQVQGISPLVLDFLFRMHHAHQFFLWVLGMVLIVWGMTGGLPLTNIWTQFRFWKQDPDTRWVILLIVIGLAVRMVALESANQYYTDETNFASAVTRLRTQPATQIMNNIGPVANFTWVYSYLQYYFSEVFGATLANLRAVSVFVGTVTIPAIYVLGRWAFNRRIGLLAGFLLTFYLPHIHYSRLAMNNIVDPLLGILAIAFLWRGLQTESRRLFALAGVCLGLTSYFYEGGRLLYPALIGGWLVVYAVLRNGHISRRGIMVFIASTLLVASGFYISLSVWGFQNVAPRLLQQRVNEEFWAEFFTSSNTVKQISRYFDERLNPPYLHIVSQPDGSRFYYSREVGLTLPYMLPFMLIGLGVACFHWRRLGLILPWWIILTVLGNSLLDFNDWTARFVVLFPALVLLIALGLDRIYRAIQAGWLQNPTGQRVFHRISTSLLLVVGVMQIAFYFGVMMPDYNVAIRTEIDDQDAGRRAQILSPGAIVYVLAHTPEFHTDVIDVQAYEQHIIPVEVVVVADFDFAMLESSADYPYGFFVVQNDVNTLNRLRQIFGSRLQGPYWSTYHVPLSHQYAMYIVEPR